MFTHADGSALAPKTLALLDLVKQDVAQLPDELPPQITVPVPTKFASMQECVTQLTQLVIQQLVAGGYGKQAFVSDPAAMGMGGGGMGAPPGGGGMDPAAMGGGGGGGGMPMDPMAAGTGGIDPMVIQQIVQQVMTQQGMAGGGAGGAGANALKPKVDVNVVLLQMLKVLVQMAEHMGIPISPSSMVPTQEGINQLAADSQNGFAAGLGGYGAQSGQQPPGAAMGGMPPQQPAAGGGGGEKSSEFADGQGIEPLGPALSRQQGRAQALGQLLRNRQQAA